MSNLNASAGAPKRTPAAQYIRMSSDVQQGSPINQAEAIAHYASENGFEVVTTYVDEARSGLQIRDRPAFRRLLSDVQGEEVGFKVVLVYDVNRWGRFQEVDRAAYYDYHCRMHGVRIIYVAEAFSDTDSPFSAVMKSMRRAMAADYSRELAVKVRAGQARLAALGYWVCASASLGHRRQIVDAHGNKRAVLQVGERKAMHSERTIIVLGPPSEVALVKHIFNLYSKEKMNLTQLVLQLAQEGHRVPEGMPFTYARVRTILGNEAYTGSHTWGKKHTNLGAGETDARPEELVHRHDCIEPIISKHQYKKVAAKLAACARARRDPERLLDDLRRAVMENPHLTSDALPRFGCATRQSYETHFGSFGNALGLIGHVRDLEQQNRLRNTSLKVGKKTMHDIAVALSAAGGITSHLTNQRYFELNRTWRVGLKVVRTQTRNGHPGWEVRKEPGRATFHAQVIARLLADGSLKDFFIVPGERIKSFPSWLSERNDPAVDALCFPNIGPLATLLP